MTEIRILPPGEEVQPGGGGEWRLVAERSGRRLGGLSLSVEPTTSDPAWQGTLPPTELTVFGIDLPWEGAYLEVGIELLTGAARELAGSVPDQVQTRVNRSLHQHLDQRRRLLDAYGLGLFQEKRGFRWVDPGRPIEVPDRLEFLTIEETGEEAYAAVMARCGEGTLDRNDHYYWTGCGPDNWAAQMMVYLQPSDARMWLMASHLGEPVGFVAVGSDDDWGSTIVHIGVDPRHRGHGYVNDLVLAGTAAAQSGGIHTMLSDVDVVNGPMMEAMRRNGHDDDPGWHGWHLRGPFHSS